MKQREKLGRILLWQVFLIDSDKTLSWVTTICWQGFVLTTTTLANSLRRVIYAFCISFWHYHYLLIDVMHYKCISLKECMFTKMLRDNFLGFPNFSFLDLNELCFFLLRRGHFMSFWVVFDRVSPKLSKLSDLQLLFWKLFFILW